MPVRKGAASTFAVICGGDIGKNNHEASVIDQDGRRLAKSFRFTNTTPGAESLLEYIDRCNAEKDVVVIGMEATGHYWLSLYCFLFDAGFQVNVINPIQSDAKDSFLIAETIRIGRYSKTEMADEDILSLCQLCRHRMDLVFKRQNRLHWKHVYSISLSQKGNCFSYPYFTYR